MESPLCRPRDRGLDEGKGKGQVSGGPGVLSRRRMGCPRVRPDLPKERFGSLDKDGGSVEGGPC